MFYTTDMMVLIDIVTRQLTDLSQGDEVSVCMCVCVCVCVCGGGGGLGAVIRVFLLYLAVFACFVCVCVCVCGQVDG